MSSKSIESNLLSGKFEKNTFLKPIISAALSACFLISSTAFLSPFSLFSALDVIPSPNITHCTSSPKFACFLTVPPLI